MVVDADGERTRSTGSADGDAARAGKSVDPEGAVGDGDGGAAGDVQVGGVVGPDLVAIAAAGEDAALDIDHRAGTEREGRDGRTPLGSAIAGFHQGAGAAETGADVIAVDRRIEGERGAGEDRMDRGSVDVLIGQAAGRDRGLARECRGGGEGRVTGAEFEQPPRAGDSVGQRGIRRLVEVEQAVVDDAAEIPEAGRHLEDPGDVPGVGHAAAAGLDRGAQAQRAGEGTDIGKRRLTGDIELTDAITNATRTGGQLHRVSDAGRGRHVLSDQVGAQGGVGRTVHVRAGLIDQRLDVRAVLDESDEDRLDVRGIPALHLEASDIRDRIEGGLIDRPPTRDGSSSILAAGDPSQDFGHGGVRGDSLGSGREVRIKERAVGAPDLDGARTRQRKVDGDVVAAPDLQRAVDGDRGGAGQPAGSTASTEGKRTGRDRGGAGEGGSRRKGQFASAGLSESTASGDDTSIGGGPRLGDG